MILLCSGLRSEKAFDALLFLAETLNASGQKVAIDSRFVPGELSRHSKYESAPFLVDKDDIDANKLVVIGADLMTEEVQHLLRAAPITQDAEVWAFGRFKSRQAGINAATRIASSVGKEPNVIDLAVLQETPLHDDGLSVCVTAIKPDSRPDDNGPTKIMVYLPGESLEDPSVLSGLLALHYTANVKLHVLTNGTGKSLIQNSRFSDISVFGLADLPSLLLLNFADIVVFTGPNMPGPRMANLALQAIGNGRPVVDCTVNAALAATGAPVLSGPHDMLALAPFIDAGPGKNARAIGAAAQKSNWLRSYDADWLNEVLGLSPNANEDIPTSSDTVFFPTNGSGLGHAQRCALIAEAMDDRFATHFAAFPSCVQMLQSRGFPTTPMVQRSDMLGENYDNDLVNYLRLRCLVKRGDQLVFDGGYVFDSVYRVISELQIPAVWVRRGLWQPGQVNPGVLERERVFSKVIVPTEAFDELNASYTHGAHVHTVGPIVARPAADTADTKELKEKLESLFGHSPETLVVSMLGGGVASERSVQTQALCNMVEARKDTMHLIVAWPNAIVPSSYYGWSKSHVVTTRSVQSLCHIADVVVSAAGYNSFHEILYHQIPAILIPQSAPFLDDQETRARAASKRGAASIVLETDLVRLEQEVAAILDGGKSEELRAALSELSLPETGNAAAARIIEAGHLS